MLLNLVNVFIQDKMPFECKIFNLCKRTQKREKRKSMAKKLAALEKEFIDLYGNIVFYSSSNYKKGRLIRSSFFVTVLLNLLSFVLSLNICKTGLPLKNVREIG